MTAAQTLADVAAAYLINARVRDDLQDFSERSREAALHDPLTGQPNRVSSAGCVRSTGVIVAGKPC
jgi:hypothetical protein